MPDIGAEGQRKIGNAKVIVIGTGGLGSPILSYLAAAGIGTIRFVDNDVVDLSNLNRQVIHDTLKIGQRKVDSARSALQSLNPDITLEPVDVKFTRDNAKELFNGIQYAIDASDNLEAKFLTNDAAIEAGIPCTVGGVIRWDGQMLSVRPGRSTCYRCVFGEEPPEGSMKAPAELGIIGVTAGLLGVIAASEAIKYFLGFPDEACLVNRMLMVDVRSLDFAHVAVKRNPTCKACGGKA
ncbi:MAG: HesA/MoeB/ThiF family protein [Candidatus Lokiarchaeota archaeon]|nr:HesA/MoeB/ThiF family protein [Candidatus Lokiarchaeota archaeon]